MSAVNYVLRSFEGNINPGYPTGIKIYLQVTKDIDNVDHSISLANKYGSGRLALMVNTGAGTKNVSRAVESIFLE